MGKNRKSKIPEGYLNDRTYNLMRTFQGAVRCFHDSWEILQGKI
jgi:hypothetical protein